ncbi:MAG: rhodanese-like domain-containing protein [Phycisphaerales bacterium]
MARCAHTVSGVLMIVGLAYIGGTVQSLVRDKPIVLLPVMNAPGQPPAQADPPPEDAGAADDPAENTPISEEIPDADTPEDEAGARPVKNAEYEARLDAPVPEGMLTLRQAHQHWIDGAYFIDSRRRDQFIEGRVSGAAYLTAENILTDAGDAILASIPPDAPVVIYCTGGEACDASKNTMALLQPLGYTNLMIMGSGYADWEAAGLPVERGEPETMP